MWAPRRPRAAPPPVPRRSGRPGTPPARGPDRPTVARPPVAPGRPRPAQCRASGRSPTGPFSWLRLSSDAERRRALTGIAPELGVEKVSLVLEVRVEAHRDLQLANAFGLAADLQEDPADVRVSVGVRRMHGQRSAVGDERLVVALEPRRGDAQIELGPQV